MEEAEAQSAWEHVLIQTRLEERWPYDPARAFEVPDDETDEGASSMEPLDFDSDMDVED